MNLSARIRNLVRVSCRPSAAGFSLTEQLIVVAIVLILAAISIPALSRTMQYMRTSGDARGLADITMEAKMRAAANFTHSRIYINTSALTYHIETWNKAGTSPCSGGTPCWQTEAGTFTLSSGVSLGYGSLSSPPPSTQASIGQPGACLDSTHDTGTSTVANTACIEFNSRGIPIDSSWSPTSNYALYVNDGNSVYAVTVSATGSIVLWRADKGASSCSGGACWSKR
jgi:prepilin-type N-terminal cleavage/methylation domain-containing protein